MEYFKTCVAPESLGYIMVGTLLLVWGQRVIFPTTQYGTSGGWMQREGPNVPSACVWHLPKHQSSWTQYSPSADAPITRWMGGWGTNRLRMCMGKWKHSVIISAEVMRGAHGSSNLEHKRKCEGCMRGRLFWLMSVAGMLCHTQDSYQVVQACWNFRRKGLRLLTPSGG